MDDLDRCAARAQSLGDLEQAARVTRRHYTRARLDDVGHLAFEQPVGHLRLEHVVDAGAAAAEVALGQLDEREARDAPEQLARLVADPLAVRQMAGVVVRHGDVEPAQRQVRAGQDLADVASARRERPRRRCVRQPVRVLLHRGATAGGVADDEVDAGAERPCQRRRLRAEFVEPPRVKIQGAAAPLPTRHHHVVAREREQPQGVAVDVRIEVTLHAAREQSDASAACSARPRDFGQSDGRRHVGQHLLHGGEARHDAQEPGSAHEPLPPAALIEAERAQQRAQARRIREDAVDEGRQHPAVPGSAVPLDLRARRLEQLAERHAGRTRRLAGATAEAEVEVPAERLGERDPSLGGRAHEIETAPWRVHFLAEHTVGRTLRQADPAVDARADRVEIRRVGTREGARHHSPLTKRPGLSRRSGSNVALIDRISASAPAAIGPQGSIAQRTATGPPVTTT